MDDAFWSWTHIGIIATVMAPVVAAWWDNRQTQRKHWRDALQAQDDHWQETERRQDMRHTENRERFATIETKLDPVWKWYTDGGTK